MAKQRLGLQVKNHIAKYRKEARLSQQELADLITVSRKTISTVETNRFTPSVIIALKIARQFNTSVESLFEIEEHD
nr:helix-turn-helix transcriptional regulator [Pseudoalteromonas carrageenovora]